MTLIYPERGDDSSEHMLSEAQETYQRTTSVLNVLVRQLEANRFDHVGETTRILRELKNALQSAINERERVEKQRDEKQGIVNGYAIDFDAARHEVGRRLARLRAAGSEGSVSERSE